MVFHVGVLWRLNETKLLSKIKRFSSVSGGSITAGVLARGWRDLRFQNGVASNFAEVVVQPVRQMASTSIDLGAVFWGSVLPGSVAERVAKAYREHLFDDTTLQDLPDEPRFVFNATNLESGVAFRFSKPYMGDYRVGRIFDPKIELAVAVAASSAFPPVLSPCVLDLSDETWKDDEGNDLGHKPGFRDEIKLTDGGVYDNMGLETAWKRYKTILVSDAGGHVEEDPDPTRTGCDRPRECSSSSTTRSAPCASAKSSNPSAWTRRECTSESAARSPASRSRCSARTQKDHQAG